MTNQEAKKVLAVLLVHYVRHEVQQATVEAWARSLEDLPADVAAKAVQRLASRSKWVPSLSEIRMECAEIIHGDMPAPAIVLLNIHEQIRSGGASWCHPLAAEIVQAFGRRRLSERIDDRTMLNAIAELRAAKILSVAVPGVPPYAGLEQSMQTAALPPHLSARD